MHLIRGEVEVELDGTRHRLSREAALATHGAEEIRLMSDTFGQAVLLGGTPFREPFVQKGPFEMHDADQLEAVIAAHAAGKLGSID
ncbi:pirin-like C-terminal cupin domain-containing protein [Roseivivax lentus]|nr:pirin-like C-terminal cupin domain-containing protein [Roseivivax lentus]